MIFNDNNLEIKYINANYIVRKNSRDTSINIYANDDSFISFCLNKDFDPRNISINETISLIDHIYWDVSFKNNKDIYVFDITKESLKLTRLDNNSFKLTGKIENPDLYYTKPEGLTFNLLEIDTKFSFVYEDIKCMLTSTMDLSDKDENGNKISKVFDNKNEKLDTIKKYVKKYDNFLYVAATESEFEVNDFYAKVVFDSFDMTLPFKNYQILDSRVKDMESVIKNADLIYLSGGHVPTQNKFFNNINLRELIRNTNAFIIGVSAGSMNSADSVYGPPEYEEEVFDPSYQKFYKGLGLTHLNVFPHYDEIKDEMLAGKSTINDIVLPDSYDRDIYALNNGSYILIDDNEYIYGEAYLMRDGKIKQICKDNKHTVNKEWRF